MQTIDEAIEEATADVLRRKAWIDDRLIRRPAAEREYERYCDIGLRERYLDVLAEEARWHMIEERRTAAARSHVGMAA